MAILASLLSFPAFSSMFTLATKKALRMLARQAVPPWACRVPYAAHPAFFLGRTLCSVTTPKTGTSDGFIRVPQEICPALLHWALLQATYAARSAEKKPTLLRVNFKTCKKISQQVENPSNTILYRIDEDGNVVPSFFNTHAKLVSINALIDFAGTKRVVPHFENMLTLLANEQRSAKIIDPQIRKHLATLSCQQMYQLFTPEQKEQLKKRLPPHVFGTLEVLLR